MAGRLASAASASAACLLFLLLVSLDSVRGFRHAQASLPSSHRGRAATPPPVAAAAPPSAGDGEQQQPQQQPQQQSMSLLFPPTRRPTSIVFEDRRNGIWTFEQPFYTTTNIKTRMTLLDLGQGALLLYAPIAATSECVDMVRAATKGRLPTHIIMHSDAIDHTIFLSGWRRAAPQAQVLAVKPDASKGDLPLVSVDDGSGRLEARLPPALTQGGLLDAAVFDCRPFFQEVVLFHKRTRSVLCADAIWRVVSPRFSPNVIAASGWKGFGVSNRSAHPYWFYFPRRRKEEVRAFVQQVDSWGDIDRVLPGHLDPIPTSGEEGMDRDEVKRLFVGSFDYIVR